jgi:hypothetical protein
LLAGCVAGAIGWAVAVSRASGSALQIDFPAAASPTRVFSPESWGWLALNSSTTGQEVLQSGGTRFNAWRVSDTVAALPNPAYVHGMSSRAASDAATHGWQFAAFARYVEDLGPGPNQGLTVFLNNREYSLLFDLNAVGDLQATLFDESSASFVLTGGGTGTEGFHHVALRGRAGTAAVDFLFDGALVNANRPWDGRPLGHPDTVQWGNSNRAGASRGVMDYHYVMFDVGPYDHLPGDYDRDGKVAGDDLLIWQRLLGAADAPHIDGDGNGIVDDGEMTAWAESFGVFGGQAANGSTSLPVPEPFGWELGLGACLGGLTARRKRAS